MNPIDRVVSISPLARAASASGPAAAGTSANSAGWLTATPKPSSDHQRQQRPQAVDPGEHRAHDGRLAERHDDQDPAVLEAVDECAGDSRRQHDRSPEREDQRRDGERRAGPLLHVEDQREDRHEIAERGDAGRSGEKAQVTTA